MSYIIRHMRIIATFSLNAHIPWISLETLFHMVLFFFFGLHLNANAFYADQIHSKITKKFYPLAILIAAYYIWKERNQRIFKNTYQEARLVSNNIHNIIKFRSHRWKHNRNVSDIINQQYFIQHTLSFFYVK